jgi:L-rhamnonate dehydratase
MAEFLMMSPKADTIGKIQFLIRFTHFLVPLFGNLFVNEPVPKNGIIEIPDTPGWGVELNREKLELKRPHKRN